jgi:hypothetical protein
LDSSPEHTPHPLNRSRRSLAFADSRGALKQRRDLTQLFAELLFVGHLFIPSI